MRPVECATVTQKYILPRGFETVPVVFEWLHKIS